MRGLPARLWRGRNQNVFLNKQLISDYWFIEYKIWFCYPREVKQKGFIPLLVIIGIVLIGTIGGFLLVQFLQKTNYSTTSRQATKTGNTSFNSISPTGLQISPIAVLGTKSFQSLIMDNCKNGEISTAVLPFKIDLVAIKQMQPSSTVGSTLVNCFYSNEKNGGYVYMPVDYSGNRAIYIYSETSPDPDCLLCNAFIHDLKKAIVLNNNMWILPRVGLSDGPMTLDQIDVEVIGVKKIQTPNSEFLYAQLIGKVIPAGDKRLINILKKYNTEYDEIRKVYLVDRSKFKEMSNDVEKAFFSNPRNLNEPEKANVDKLQLPLNAISSK